MIYKYVFTLSIVASILGCDREEPGRINLSSNDTAMYLPGGLGLNFGVSPTSQRLAINTKKQEYKVVRYEINGTPDEVSSAVNTIFINEGYARAVLDGGSEEKKVVYRKGKSNPIQILYTPVVKDGLKRKSVVTFTWYIQG